MCQQDLAFICGKINGDEYLASLYYRDEKIEVNEYETQFSNKTALEEIENMIRNLAPSELEERILMHADLTKNFRHFQILKLEPYDESEPLDVQNVPFLLSKTANLKRYYAGNFQRYQCCHITILVIPGIPDIESYFSPKMSQK